LSEQVKREETIKGVIKSKRKQKYNTGGGIEYNRQQEVNK
jgi:hypothetical protein